MSNLPFWAYVVFGILALSSFWGFQAARGGVGTPFLAVLGTVAIWYVGDVIYNNYSEYHVPAFTPDVLTNVWIQIGLFLIAFSLMVPVLHGVVNRSLTHQESRVHAIYQQGTVPETFHQHLSDFLKGCIGLWLLLGLCAVALLKGETLYYFFPFLGYKADPWARGQIGGGFSALLSLAGYLQLFMATGFGVVAALAQNRTIRALALAGCALTWPYYLFDRTRNVMIAVALPGLLSWVFLRLRFSLLGRFVVLGVCFLALNAWFKFVLETRSEGLSIAGAFREGRFFEERDVQHLGLNMFEELCWINTFIEDGTYEPNTGRRYFAELVNPIPRGLWPDKPPIGLDYAVARGQEFTEDGTVTATVSTGLIGQGVVNFGPWLGPVFAAFLMAVWVTLLARLDLTGDRIGRLPLYALGLVLTFNLGRDITFITLYTFVFGAIIVWLMERRQRTAPTRDFPPSSSLPARYRASISSTRKPPGT